MSTSKIRTDKITFAVLWKRSRQLQNLIRALNEFDEMDQKKKVVRLWYEVKKQSTVRTAKNVDPEKIRRDVDNRFQLFHQSPTESVSTFI